MYTVEFTEIALKNLKRYPRKDQNLILKNIGELAADPLVKSNVKKPVDFGGLSPAGRKLPGFVRPGRCVEDNRCS